MFADQNNPQHKIRNTMLRRAKEPPLVTGTETHSVLENNSLFPTTIRATVATTMYFKHKKPTLPRHHPATVASTQKLFFANSVDYQGPVDRKFRRPSPFLPDSLRKNDFRDLSCHRCYRLLPPMQLFGASFLRTDLCARRPLHYFACPRAPLVVTPHTLEALYACMGMGPVAPFSPPPSLHRPCTSSKGPRRLITSRVMWRFCGITSVLLSSSDTSWKWCGSSPTPCLQVLNNSFSSRSWTGNMLVSVPPTPPSGVSLSEAHVLPWWPT